MLSAAHILAMNAKNLLDVIDNVRIKHPHVDVLFTAPSWSDMTAQHHPSHSKLLRYPNKVSITTMSITKNNNQHD